MPLTEVWRRMMVEPPNVHELVERGYRQILHQVDPSIIRRLDRFLPFSCYALPLR